jgi:hypothetical protein
MVPGRRQADCSANYREEFFSETGLPLNDVLGVCRLQLPVDGFPDHGRAQDNAGERGYDDVSGHGQILNVLAYSSAISRHTSRRSASKVSHSSLACSLPPFGHVLFGYLEAGGAPICAREGFAQRLGLHIVIVEENKLSNRSGEAPGLSLSFLAQHAHPAYKFGLVPAFGLVPLVGLDPLGSAISCAPNDGIVSQTDIAYRPEIILNLPAEFKDLGEVVALLL